MNGHGHVNFAIYATLIFFFFFTKHSYKILSIRTQAWKIIACKCANVQVFNPPSFFFSFSSFSSFYIAFRFTLSLSYKYRTCLSYIIVIVIFTINAIAALQQGTRVWYDQKHDMSCACLPQIGPTKSESLFRSMRSPSCKMRLPNARFSRVPLYAIKDS